MRSTLLTFAFSLSLVAGGLGCGSSSTPHLDGGTTDSSSSNKDSSSSNVDSSTSSGSCLAGEECCTAQGVTQSFCVGGTCASGTIPDDIGMCDVPATGCPTGELCYKGTGMTGTACFTNAGGGQLGAGSGAVACTGTGTAGTCATGVKVVSGTTCVCLQACTSGSSCSNSSLAALTDSGNCFCMRTCQ